MHLQRKKVGRIDSRFLKKIFFFSLSDIICLLLFLAFIGGWVAIAIWGFQSGTPLVLVYPSDSDGLICGRGNNA